MSPVTILVFSSFVWAKQLPSVFHIFRGRKHWAFWGHQEGYHMFPTLVCVVKGVERLFAIVDRDQQW